MQNFPSCVDVFKVTLQSEFDFLLGSTLASRRQRESAFFSAIDCIDATPVTCDPTQSSLPVRQSQFVVALLFGLASDCPDYVADFLFFWRFDPNTAEPIASEHEAGVSQSFTP